VAEIAWGPSLADLAALLGKVPQDPKLRTLLGRWCKLHGEARVVAVVAEASARSPPPVEPVSWIEARLNGGSNGADRGTSGYAGGYGGRRGGRESPHDKLFAGFADAARGH